MKIIAILSVLSIAPIALAHPDHFPPEHPDHPSEHPSDNPEHPAKDASANESATAEAKAIFDKVHKKYKEAKGIKESITLTMPSMMGGEAEVIEAKILVGAKGGSLDLADEMSATWSDGKCYLTTSQLDNKYTMLAADSLYSGLTEVTGGGGIPGVWTLALRDSDDMDDWITSFSLGFPGIEVTGVTTEKDDEGNDVDVISLKSMMGTVDITVARDGVIKSGIITISQPGMPSMEISAISSIEFLKEAPVVTFDAGDRELISPEVMLNGEGADASAPAEEIATGKPAPDFTLSKMDGSGDVTLSSLKGQVVVLDFWATWCPPCRKGLPFLNEFDTWAKNEGWKVNVFAVNVWERGDKDAVDTIVKKFWAEKKFTTAVLMGSSDSKLTSNYGVSGIPTTVIIGPDGSISSQHSGFAGGEAMLKDLKESVAKALGKDVDSAKPEHPDHPDHPN